MKNGVLNFPKAPGLNFYFVLVCIGNLMWCSVKDKLRKISAYKLSLFIDLKIFFNLLTGR